MYMIHYLKNMKQNKTTKYTDNNSDGYNVQKRNVFLSQKKKEVCKEVRTVCSASFENKKHTSAPKDRCGKFSDNSRPLNSTF